MASRIPRHPDRRAVDELINELRDEAIELAPDLRGIAAQETVYGEAAQTLEEFGAALTLIAAGLLDPKALAVDALSLAKPLLPLSDEAAPLRDMLKPKLF